MAWIENKHQLTRKAFIKAMQKENKNRKIAKK